MKPRIVIRNIVIQQTIKIAKDRRLLEVKYPLAI
jgi:hypothetical protein